MQDLKSLLIGLGLAEIFKLENKANGVEGRTNVTPICMWSGWERMETLRTTRKILLNTEERDIGLIWAFDKGDGRGGTLWDTLN